MRRHPKIDDRLPPHSEDAERGALACCLLDPQGCVPELVARFGSDVAGAFYVVQNQVVAQAMVKLAEKGGGFDLVALVQYLKDMEDLEMAGGSQNVQTLPDASPSAANIGTYLDILQAKHRLRKLLKVCTEASAEVFKCNGESEALIDGVERDILAVRQFGGKGDQRTMKQVVQGAVDRIEQAFNLKGAMDGLPTGLLDWDRMTGGLQRTELTVLGGLPGSGKTALAMNVASHAAADLGRPVAVFSLEMSAERLAMRMLCSYARVNLKHARTGSLTEGDFKALSLASVKLAGCPVHWEDQSDLSLPELRAKARRLKNRHGVELFVVDYLQLVDGASGGRDENEEKQLSNIARSLKAVAMELDVPVLALSQLNDGGKLRGSRAIGHHADNVCRLTKRQKEEDEEEDLGADAVPVDLLVLKQRNGPTGKVPLTFLRCYTRFENAARAQDAGVPE